MPSRRGYNRTDRVGDQIQQELAQLITYELKDPRLGMITITGVEVNREFDHAKVYITVMQGDQTVIDTTLDVLNKAAGFLRKELGRNMRLRTIPQLHFFYDDSIERGSHMSSLIESAIADDQAKKKED